jgi:hypothetical protein
MKKKKIKIQSLNAFPQNPTPPSHHTTPPPHHHHTTTTIIITTIKKNKKKRTRIDAPQRKLCLRSQLWRRDQKLVLIVVLPNSRHRVGHRRSRSEGK